MTPQRLLVGVGPVGSRLAAQVAATGGPQAWPRVVRVDATTGRGAPEDPDAPVDHPLPSGGRGVSRAWALGRWAWEQAPKLTLEPAPVTLVCLGAGEGIGAGAGPGVLQALVAGALPHAFTAAAVVLPQHARPGTAEAENAAYALGELVQAGPDAIFLLDPGHVEATLAVDPDPFLLGPVAEPLAGAAAFGATVDALGSLLDAGWTPMDLALAFRGAGGARASLVTPAYLRVSTADLDHVNLAGWTLAALEGSRLSGLMLDDAEAAVVLPGIPSGLIAHPGLRGADAIAAILRSAAPRVRAEVEVRAAANEGAPGVGEIVAFLVGSKVTRVRHVALAGASALLDPDHATRLERELAAVAGGAGAAVAPTYVKAYEAAVSRLSRFAATG